MSQPYNANRHCLSYFKINNCSESAIKINLIRSPTILETMRQSTMLKVAINTRQCEPRTSRLINQPSSSLVTHN